MVNNSPIIMNYYRYTIANEEVKTFVGEITSLPVGFIEYEITLSGKSVYYKLVNGKITEMIGEGNNEDIARERVEEFLSEFLATPFEPL